MSVSVCECCVFFLSCLCPHVNFCDLVCGSRSDVGWVRNELGDGVC